MNSVIPLHLAIDVPEQFKKNISYGMLAVMALSAVYCIVKCIQGADMLDQGEDGKKKIYSGIAIGAVPWLALEAFKIAGIAEKIGLEANLQTLPELDDNIAGVLTLAIWAVIGIAAVWCVIKCIAGARMLEQGEQGKGKIISGLAIGAAPWFGIAALKLAGFWTMLHIDLAG